VHKAQGSEFTEVYVVIPWSGGSISKELLYTACTRHTERLILLLEVPEQGEHQLRRRRLKSDIKQRETLLPSLLDGNLQ